MNVNISVCLIITEKEKLVYFLMEYNPLNGSIKPRLVTTFQSVVFFFHLILLVSQNYLYCYELRQGWILNFEKRKIQCWTNNY